MNGRKHVGREEVVWQKVARQKFVYIGIVVRIGVVERIGVVVRIGV